MTSTKHPVVGRMQGLWPHQLAGFEMHRKRVGGDLEHVDPERTNFNRRLHGREDWATQVRQAIDEIRHANHGIEIAKLERRKRRKDVEKRLAEGPSDPWRATRHGPMRELILTANKEWFAQGSASAGMSREEQFEACAMNWLKSTFGADLVHARADMDEEAYHIHAVIFPLVRTKDGRLMLQPSKHEVIESYELFQDKIGAAFAPIGLRRGDARAQAVRDALQQGEEPPPFRPHKPTWKWRREQTAKEKDDFESYREATLAELYSMHDEIDARVEMQDAASGLLEAQQALFEAEQKEKAAELARREKEVAERSAEQDAVFASVDALAAGMIVTTDLGLKLEPDRATNQDAAQSIMATVRRSPAGWRRFAKALAPAWERLRQTVQKDAAATLARETKQIEKEQREVEGAWTDLGQMANELMPAQASRFAEARQRVAKVLATWKFRARPASDTSPDKHRRPPQEER